MSSTAPGGIGEGSGDRPRRLQRILRRARTVLGRNRSKREPQAPSAPLVPESSGGVISSTTEPTAPSTQPLVETPKQVAEEVASAPSPSPLPPPISQPEVKTEEPGTETVKPKGLSAAESYELQKEKARAMFAKYNLTLEEGEWTPVFKGDGIRVEKKVRIRIHRHCHRCETSFGVEKLCNNCGHTRCKKCPKTRLSSRRDVRDKISITSGSILVDDAYKTLMMVDPLNMPYRRSVKELLNPPYHRRICHKCQTSFIGNAPQCSKCGHSRCAQCPRDPPMVPPLPDPGYPRRRQMQPLRLRVRFTCHECQRTFKDLERACAKCGHEKCDKCPSDPHLEGPPSLLDPEALRQVEERLRNMDVSPQATAA